MVKYRNARGRVITRSAPDKWLEASKRWDRVKPLRRAPMPQSAPDPAPEPEAAREQDNTDADASTEKE